MTVASKAGEPAADANAAPADYDRYTEDFAQADRAADTAAASQTPAEMLGEYLPNSSSIASTNRSNSTSDGRTRSVSTQTAPTSIDFEDAAGDMPDDASEASSEDESFRWNTNEPLFGQRQPRAARPRTRRSGQPKPLPTFNSVYYTNIPEPEPWRCILLAVNTLVFLSSVAYCAYLFRQLLAERVSNRTVQAGLLGQTFLWLFCMSVDGVLRLRTREQISISVMAQLLLMIVLSTFARHLTVPTAQPVAMQAI